MAGNLWMNVVTRIAALYDIHGNLPALDAVLEDVRRAEVELIVVGGDRAVCEVRRFALPHDVEGFARG